MRNYRVIQWGTGYTGAFSLRYILSNPNLELVGVKCHTADKEGKKAGEFCNRSGVGVAATTQSAKLLALDADCVIFMPRDYLTDPSVPGGPSSEWLKDMIAILESGKNVVTSIVTGTHWRHLARGSLFRDLLNAACKKGNSTVHFTGFDPGFATDLLPFTLAGVVGEIEQIRTWEIIDYSTYPVLEPLMQLGFGVRPQELAPGGMAAIPIGWGGGLHVLCDAMGVTVEKMEVGGDIFLSPKTFTASGGLLVKEGTIGASRWSLSAIVNGKPRVVINHVNRIGGDMAPDWPTLGRDGGYRIEIDAYPPLKVDLPMGLPGGAGTAFADAMAMTAARCVNSVEAVVLAPPGYRTLNDLPPIGGKYAYVK